MAKLYFRYGIGKTSDLCQTAYNFNEKNFKVIILNPKNNEKLVTRIKNEKGIALLSRKIDLHINDQTNLFDLIKQKTKAAAILVDNCEYLTKLQAEQLYFVAKILDITVICYGDRTLKSKESIMRLMELSNNLEQVDSSATSKESLEFFYGAMNCSKTAKLLYLKKELELQNKKVCLVKPKFDRDIDFVISRIGMKEKADIVIDKEDSFLSFKNIVKIENVHMILVDEAQFLTEKQINELRKIVDAYNIPVRCYGLKMDFLTHHFEGSGRLLEIADSIYKLRTVCDCGVGAEMNARMDKDGTFQNAGEQIVIDSGNYTSLCDKCYIEKVLKTDVNSPTF